MKRFGSIVTPDIESFYKLAERAVLIAEEKKAEIKSSDGEKKLTVEQFDNHVYFYANVDSDRCLALMKNIREIDTRLRQERDTRDIPSEIPATPIWLHIHSGGGDLFTGLSMADQLAEIRTPIYSIVEGLCASAATLMSIACSQRYITPRSFMLIHQLFTFHWGTYEEFKDEMKLQDMLMDVLVKFYVSKTRVTEEQIREILKRDSWFNAEESLKLGIVDKIMATPTLTSREL